MARQRESIDVFEEAEKIVLYWRIWYGIFSIMKKSRLILTPAQIQTLNNVLIAAGQITSGSLAAPFLFPAVDKPPAGVLVFGVASTLVLWITPIVLARRLKRI